MIGQVCPQPSCPPSCHDLSMKLSQPQTIIYTTQFLQTKNRSRSHLAEILIFNRSLNVYLIRPGVSRTHTRARLDCQKNVGQHLDLTDCISIKVAVSTSIAEEVLGNLTTVKSFAMEEEEVAKYGNSLDAAAAAYSRLGLGIGLFTAGSALATNGIIFISNLQLYIFTSKSIHADVL